MPELYRVGMTLTQRDLANVAKLKLRTGVRNKAQAVSFALSLSESIVTAIENGSTLVVHYPNDGLLQELVIPGLVTATQSKGSS